jgi:hypothetical protein
MARSKARKSLDSEDAIVRACLGALRTLGRSIEVELVEPPAPKAAAQAADAVLRIRFGSGRSERFLVETKRTHLSYALASGIIAQVKAKDTRDNWVLFAPYVPGPIGNHLAAHELSYVDAVGNCHLETKTAGLLAHVEGKRVARGGSASTGVRLPGYQLIFAILAQPDLLGQPVRKIATVAGIGKTAVGDQLQRLARQGLITRTLNRGAIPRRRDLLDRWLSAYPDVVRPAWHQGRYRTRASDPEEIEQLIADAWGKRRWSVGGGAAAWRMNRFYRGAGTLIHVDAAANDELRRLGALPDEQGDLTILRTPGTAAYAGAQPHLVHPLLVYTELMTSEDPRLREAAEKVRQEFMKDGL